MVYTVTFNPSLDYIVSVEDFKLGMTNRTGSERILPGGKGLNVSMVLSRLGIDSTAFGFTAGFTGAEIARRVEEMGVRADFILLGDSGGEGFSRINLKLKNIEGTEINGCGPRIGREAVEQLMGKLDRLEEGDVLVLAGSIPNSVSADIYERIMERLAGKGVIIVVDAAGELLRRVLERHPFLVKPNHHELGELFGKKITSREEAASCAERLRDMGAMNVLVSMAGEGAVLAAEDGKAYQAPAPEGKLVNGVGAGDSMVAGFLAGWMEQKDYAHAFYMGLAAGSASAFSEELAGKDEIMTIYKRFKELR